MQSPQWATPEHRHTLFYFATRRGVCLDYLIAPDYATAGSLYRFGDDDGAVITDTDFLPIAALFEQLAEQDRASVLKTL